jgi:3-dehydroquinate synthase
VLTSLHPAHLGAGLVEAVKHGLVADAAYFRWIEQSTEALLACDPGALTRLIEWSARIKAEVVSGDERESGRRAILNAGHTVGHAVEHVTDYGVLHGDAVAIGLVVEALMAHRLGFSEQGLAPTIQRLLDRIGRPTTLDASWDDESLLAAMSRDKKVRGTALRFALPAGIGSTARDGNNWTVPVPSEIIRSVLASSRSTATLF